MDTYICQSKFIGNVSKSFKYAYCYICLAFLNLSIAQGQDFNTQFLELFSFNHAVCAQWGDSASIGQGTGFSWGINTVMGNNLS